MPSVLLARFSLSLSLSVAFAFFLRLVVATATLRGDVSNIFIYFALESLLGFPLSNGQFRAQPI